MTCPTRILTPAIGNFFSSSLLFGLVAATNLTACFTDPGSSAQSGSTDGEDGDEGSQKASAGDEDDSDTQPSGESRTSAEDSDSKGEDSNGSREAGESLEGEEQSDEGNDGEDDATDSRTTTEPDSDTAESNSEAVTGLDEDGEAESDDSDDSDTQDAEESDTLDTSSEASGLESESDSGVDPDTGIDPETDTGVDPDTGTEPGCSPDRLCDHTEYCDYQDNNCGEADEGECTERPPSTSCGYKLARVCGCDGITYSNDCWAYTGGVDVDYSGGCRCESNKDCTGDQFCQKTEGKCTAVGICTTKDRACPDEEKPVCGCNKVTYKNDCEARKAGVSIYRQGACEACFTNNDCEYPYGTNYFCKHKVKSCDTVGQCSLRPVKCPSDTDKLLVCGCDDKNYPNECEANKVGVSMQHDSACSLVPELP